MEEAVDVIQTYAEVNQLHAIIAAVAIVIVTAIIAHVATRLIRRILRSDGLPIPSASIMVNIVRIIIWSLGASIMLSACFGVDVNAIVAALGVGGLAVSLGLQDTIKNFIGGMQVTVMGIVHPGDHVSVGGVEGIVQDVSWRQTTLKDYEGSVHLIPNAQINSSTVTKVSPESLVVATVVLNTDGHDLDAVLRKMEALAKDAIEQVATLERDPWLLVTQIGEYGIWTKLRFVLEDASHAREARDAALRAVAPYTRNNVDTLPEECTEGLI